MAKSRKTMLLRLPAEVFDALTRFSEITGTVKNEMVTSLLVEAMPHLKKLTKAAEEAKRAGPESTMKVLSAALSGAMAEVQRSAHDTQFQLGLRAAGRKLAKSSTHERPP